MPRQPHRKRGRAPHLVASAHNSTQLELHVVRLLAGGSTMKEVAQTLSISIRTVAYHKFRFMERYSLHTTDELIAFAKENGLTDS